jgi:uncharacterized protein
MDEQPGLRIQVWYARPDRQIRRDLIVESGTSLEQAIRKSGILEEAPEIDLASCRTGIYGKLKALDTLLRDRDRIEIYRPLLADPKEARRKRAVKRPAAKPESKPG